MPVGAKHITNISFICEALNVLLYLAVFSGTIRQENCSHKV